MLVAAATIWLIFRGQNWAKSFTGFSAIASLSELSNTPRFALSQPTSFFLSPFYSSSLLFLSSSLVIYIVSLFLPSFPIPLIPHSPSFSPFLPFPLPLFPPFPLFPPCPLIPPFSPVLLNLSIPNLFSSFPSCPSKSSSFSAVFCSRVSRLFFSCCPSL